MGKKQLVLAARAEVSSVSTQGRQIVIKPQTIDSPLKIIGAKGVMSKYLDGAVKINATQIKSDTRLLGDRWIEVLEEILSSNCASTRLKDIYISVFSKLLGRIAELINCSWAQHLQFPGYLIRYLD